MFQSPLTLVLTGLYQTLWRAGQNTEEQDPYDSLDTMPPATMSGPSAPAFSSMLVQLSLVVTAFTLPVTAFRVVGGLDSIDAFFLTMILGFMTCAVKFGTVCLESLREEEKAAEKAGVWKKEKSEMQGHVRALEQKIEMMGTGLENKVINAADPAPSSTTCSNVTPATSKRLLFWWSPVPHTLYITVFIALPFTVGQCIAGFTTDQSLLMAVMLITGSCFLEVFWMLLLQPLAEEPETKRKVTAEVREKAVEATGLGECVKALEGKIDEMNKRLDDQAMKASEPVPSSTMPHNATLAKPQIGLFSTIDWLIIISTALMITGNLYCYTAGLISFCSMVYLITLSLVSFVIEVVMSNPRPSGQESKQEKEGISDAKKRDTEQEGVVACVKALEDKIAGMGESMESNMEAMEKRLVKDTEKLRNGLYNCIEEEADDLQANLEETLTDQFSAKNDVMRRRLEKKVSVVVKGMEGRMRQWSQEKISELNEKVSAPLEAKVVEHAEEGIEVRNGVSLGMPEQLVGLVEQLELALESEWQGIGRAKATRRLEKAIEKIMLLAWTNQPSGPASETITDFEEGWELAVGRKVCGDDAQDTMDEVFVRSQVKSQEADIDLEEWGSDDGWKLIDQM